MKINYRILSIRLLVGILFAAPTFLWAMSVDQMTVNGRVNPLGIGTNDISFGWTLDADERGAVQSAYQIRVGTTEGGSEVWDSGQVTSTRQVDIVLPAAIALDASTRYYWQVKTWDGAAVESSWSSSAWFETGLLSESDWAGADWITRTVDSPDPADWTDYTVTLEFTIDNEAFGVFLRSSADAQNAYMVQVNVADYSYPVLKPHKRTNGSYTLQDTIDLSSFGFSNASLTGTTNTLQFIVSGTTITTRLNGTTVDTRTGIAYPNGLVGFRTSGSPWNEAAYVHRVEVVENPGGTTLIDPDFSAGEHGFSGGILSGGALLVSGAIDAVYDNSPASLPLLRGAFVATNEIASARLYASAQGLYEVSINGQKAGDQFLAPGWTDYGQRIQSQTYDITGLVAPGTNVIGAALAGGWYKGQVGLGWTQVYGDTLAFVGKIKVTYTSGATEWFSTDTAWKTGSGPFVQGDLQLGEIYDANLEQPGWSAAGFDDSSWIAVDSIPSVSARLVPQPDDPIRQIDELTAVSRTEILPGTWIYDLGQNMVGVPKIVLSGTAGQTITLRHGEEIYRTNNEGKLGQLYTDNLRLAKATDTYTFAADGTVTFQPTFTQHGFRYIEMTGTSTPPAVEDVHGVVLSSDMPGGGDLETSDAMLNKLVSNIRWGQRSNFLSIPTDTPARDERLGWTGDINVFAPAAARLKDTRAFLSKWMTDVRDTQWGDGNIPAVVPRANGTFDSTGVGWADAVITVPYSVWKATGDERILRENWETMTRFYQFVYNSATGDGDLLEQGRSSWFSGDWLSLEAGWNRLEEHKVIATAYFAEDTRMMAEMADAMGESASAETWAALVPQIRAAFVTAYRNADGSLYQGTQCVYAMALGMDMIADPAQRAATADQFVDLLASDGNHLQAGFLGTPWLLPALSNIGRNDLAMTLLLNEDYPSWGFPISIGATTMWERWNSIQADLTFGPVDMNSFNHYAYGAVGDWMFGNLGGIQELEPGYKQSRIAPLVTESGLSSVSCSQQTVYGLLASEWSTSETGSVLQVDIPVNTTAEVVVPDSAASMVFESGAPVESADGVQYLRTENNAKIYAVGSGSYTFTWTGSVEPEAVSEDTQVVSFSIDWGNTLGTGNSSGNAGANIYAGVTNVSYWYNSWNGSQQNWSYSDMLGSDGIQTTIDVAINGPWEGWSVANSVAAETTPEPDTWNRRMLAAYRNSTASSPSSAFVSGLDAAGTYEVYIYFESDAGTRVGTVSDGDDETYYFGYHPESVSGSEAAFAWLQAIATDTSGYSTDANYAKFSVSGTTASTFTLLTYDAGGTNPNGGGICGVQVVPLAMAAPPAAPDGLAAASGDEQVFLSWSAVGGATSYRVKRSLTSGGPYDVVAGVTATNSTDQWVSNGAPCYYVVSALNDVGEGADSGEVVAIPSVAVSASEFVIADHAIAGGSNLSLTVSSSVLGHNYRLLATDTLTPPDWTHVLTQAGTGSSLLFGLSIASGTTNRFFKLDVERQ